ncbi:MULTISPECIES: helix-turn-helix domain-containing protein [unclassified Tatumella]|uniref:winged helix-turn-helix transcriptional regulator n=1 Tax=unclassified Tatumella TaxID=2649542 RepID=UPI001BB0A38D|nr:MULTISPECIES: helix-turn-helix domain-containing protein [unclassified Tatumella]MBS0878271.1 helix-turn-helix transcriptional regulator [Tatumella sp. JGM82]MBS0891760.1 helix-turn-helix transcriptional regulator [Tatumella sp. JGM94]MBS0902985.1 helix-turn-helix transcriptional regulator [Tatumella sp. JGM100]
MSNNLHQKYMRGELLNSNCPSRDMLKRITSRWSVLVLLALKQDVLRFSELRRKIGGVSERMLAQTLRNMEQDGFITRKAYDVVPPHVEYWLTPLGHEAEQKVVGLADWLEDNVQRIQQNRDNFERRTPDDTP